MRRIAIIGSGPTAIYTIRCLLEQTRQPLCITIFEMQEKAGKGMPYHEDWNGDSMLANIASIEIPPVTETLVDWLQRQPDAVLERLNVLRETIDERTFFPRVVLGEYFHDQLNLLCTKAAGEGSELILKTSSPVDDVMLGEHDIRLVYHGADGHRHYAHFSQVVLATGHVWPEKTEMRPGYFLSPWPISALDTIGHCHVGIRGASLSGIDTAVALAMARGAFVTDENGLLCYVPDSGTDAFHMTLMSRKGLLPEADFYHPIPYEPLCYCTAEAIDALIACGTDTLLDHTFALFKAELAYASPEYADSIGLQGMPLEHFCQAYFERRQHMDPFEWAEQNLAEAIRNQAREYTVPWRYAILRMHEVVALIAPHLTAEDHARFSAYLKPVFVDDYATVPHASIERLLALHRAGKLDILGLGEEYRLDTSVAGGGALLQCGNRTFRFPAFIEATGQRTLSATEFPFPSLRQQGVVRNVTAPSIKKGAACEIGGIAVDRAFRPLSSLPQARHLYCLGLPFLLGQFPFAQGITSSFEMGKTVAEDMLNNPLIEESAGCCRPPLLQASL
jgi:uncharacterized NAD(P)/FAD-binding protein YdhS